MSKRSISIILRALVLVIFISIFNPTYPFATNTESLEENSNEIEREIEEDVVDNSHMIDKEEGNDQKLEGIEEKETNTVKEEEILKSEDSIEAKRAPMDIGDKVTQGNVLIYDRTGNILEEPKNIKEGEELRFDVYWSIDNIKNGELVVGDYFEFNLPSEYFDFPETTKIDLEASGEKIGTFEIVPMNLENSNTAKIRIILNETAIKKSYIENGYVEILGKAIKVKAPDTFIKIGENTIPNIEILPKEDLGNDFFNAGPLSKSGKQVNTDNLINWTINYNYDVLRMAFEEDLDKNLIKNNLILIDEMPEGLIFDDSVGITVTVPIYAATDEGKLSFLSISNMNYYDVRNHNNFTKIVQDNESWEEFKNKVSGAKALSYGIYFDKTDNRYKFIMNFGSLPGDLKSPWNYNEIINLIENENRLSQIRKDYTKDAYRQINDFTDGSMAAAFTLSFYNLKVDKDYDNNRIFSNTVKLSWDKGETKEVNNIEYIKLGAGATTGEPGSVTIKKLDDKTNKPLEGASFKLQKKENDIFIDCTPTDGEKERVNDSNGEVVFKNLEKGRYKVVEVSPPKGYSKDTRFKDDKNTFVITGSEKGTIFITAFNTKENPKSITINLEAKKYINGRELKDNEFIFQAKDKDEIVRTATNNKEGNIRFKGITVSESGTYNYTINEVIENDENIIYDKTVYNVEVNVDMDISVIKIKYFNEDGTEVSEAIFENKYSIPTDPEIPVDPVNPPDPVEPDEPPITPENPKERDNPEIPEKTQIPDKPDTTDKSEIPENTDEIEIIEELKKTKKSEIPELPKKPTIIIPQLPRTGMGGMGLMTSSGVTLLLAGLWLFKKRK